MDRILESSLKENVCIDGMDLQIMPRKGRTGTRFVVRQLQERLLAKRKALTYAFNRVPSEVVWWALRKLGLKNGW